MSMSSFQAAPRIVHLERVKRIYGYIIKMKHATIRVRSEQRKQTSLHFQVNHTNGTIQYMGMSKRNNLKTALRH